MRKFIIPFLLVLLVLDIRAWGQIFGGATTSTNYTVVVGGTNSPAFVTNTFYVPLPALNINLTNVNSSETFTGQLYVIFPAVTNFVGGYTNSFAGNTNTTFSTTTIAGAASIPVTMIMSAGIGNNTNGVYVY